MKHHSFVLVLLLLSVPLTADYHQQAEKWVTEYIAQNSSISSADLEIVANLLYFSYQRSASSCKAHEVGLLMLEHTWHGWQNIAHTRLNPTNPKPFRFAPHEQTQCAHKWVEIQKDYHAATHAYAAITDAVLKEKIITNEHTNNGVTYLRKQARKAMTRSLFDVQEHLAAFLNLTEHTPLRTLEKGMGIKQFLSQYIPQLVMKSFVQAENASHIVSEECFRILATIQQATAYVWQALEKERAAYYKAHYQHLRQYIGKPVHMIVDDQGMMPHSTRTQLLPLV